MWISRPFLWFTAGCQKKARLGSFWGIAVLKLYRKGSLLFDLYVRHVQMVYSRCDILGLLEDIFSKLLGVHSFWALAMWAVKDTMVIWTIQGIRLQNRSWISGFLLKPTNIMRWDNGVFLHSFGLCVWTAHPGRAKILAHGLRMACTRGTGPNPWEDRGFLRGKNPPPARQTHSKSGPLKHDDHWEDNPFFAQQKRVPFYGFFCFNFKDSRAATIEW